MAKDNEKTQETKEQEDEKQEMQQKFMEMQMMGQQVQEIEQHMQKIDEQLNELAVMEDALKELEKTPLDTEILVPLSPGIFVKAKLMDNKNVRVNVGSKINVDKTVKEAADMIQMQVGEINNYKDSLMIQLNELTTKMKSMEQSLM